MKICVIGTRGIPDVLGGIETHCENLYPELVKLGCDVTIFCRTPYIPASKRIKEYKGVKLKYVYAPKIKSLEAIFHTLIALFICRLKNPDIVHIHAVGPSIVTPLAIFLGLKVVVTSQGPDYDRQKWGYVAKSVLKLGEKWGTKYAHSVIVVSELIKKYLEKKFNRDNISIIYNGVIVPEICNNTDYINNLGLSSKKYILAAGRFVEEKGFQDLISAYIQSEIKPKYSLVIAGDADHETAFSKKLKEIAKQNNIITPGFIKGVKLKQIFSHAALFVLPSYHEGLSLALLEAMSFNLPVLASNIEANTLVKLNEDDYFETGNVHDLTQKLNQKLDHPTDSKTYRDLVKKNYNWSEIATQTYKIYSKVLKKNVR
jgi:alpha-maltose-1-phosphate synthase